jgi:hypothetical protein
MFTPPNASDKPTTCSTNRKGLTSVRPITSLRESAYHSAEGRSEAAGVVTNSAP